MITVNTLLVVGLTAVLVPVHVEISRGEGAMTIEGIRDTQVRETRIRVRAALQQTGIDLANATIRVKVETPAGAIGQIDLAVAVAVMVIDGKLSADEVTSAAFVGELSLTGGVRPLRGVCAMVAEASRLGLARIVVPWGNQSEAARAARLAGNTTVVEPIDALPELTRALRRPFAGERRAVDVPGGLDFADVRGMHGARRALEVAAAGGHHVLLVAPPGSGSTMITRRLPTILPEMTEAETIELTTIYSVSGLLKAETGYYDGAPFRAPHHTCSSSGLIGGGHPCRPGEVTLSSHGVLLLDEMQEFRREALSSLASAVKAGAVTLYGHEGDEKHRRQYNVTFPVSPIVVGVVGPCPCGQLGAESMAPCKCSPERIEAHWNRLRTSPIWEIFDIRIKLAAPSTVNLVGVERGESSAAIRARVVKAQGAPMPLVGVGEQASDGRPLRALRNVARGASEAEMSRVLHVGRTIARLEGSATVTEAHLAEAQGLRASLGGKGVVEA